KAGKKEKPAQRSLLAEAHGEDSDPQWDGEAGTEGSDGGKPMGRREAWRQLGMEKGNSPTWMPEDGDLQIEKPEAGDPKEFQEMEERDPQELVASFSETSWQIVYEKLIQFCSIDEIGTNCPKDKFDPHSRSEDSYCEALAKAQKTEMDKLKKAKKDRHSSCSIPVSCSDPRRALGTIPAPLGAGSGLTPSS
uniref:Uncharacterized protein n=1 Tax=Zonotrichia albicollis TaxID=44394 RepID=A0A8D2N390_ZONAL